MRYLIAHGPISGRNFAIIPNTSIFGRSCYHLARSLIIRGREFESGEVYLDVCIYVCKLRTAKRCELARS
jgi:hypothetical protein